jgi:hypothetical protein
MGIETLVPPPVWVVLLEICVTLKGQSRLHVPLCHPVGPVFKAQ